MGHNMTCKSCDESISHGKYCEDCLTEKEREKSKALTQKERRQVARDWTTPLLPKMKKEEPTDEQRNSGKPRRFESR
jgi:hypothetical protein